MLKVSGDGLLALQRAVAFIRIRVVIVVVVVAVAAPTSQLRKQFLHKKKDNTHP